MLNPMLNLKTLLFLMKPNIQENKKALKSKIKSNNFRNSNSKNKNKQTFLVSGKRFLNMLPKESTSKA